MRCVSPCLLRPAKRTRAAERVSGGFGGVGAAAGEGPANDTWLWLFDFPAGALLGLVVSSAFRPKVALIGWAIRVRDRVIKVGVDGLSGTAGSIAGGRAGTDKVRELAAGGVAGLSGGVVANALGDGFEGEIQAAEERGELSRLGGRRCPLAGRPGFLSLGCPGMLS